MLSEWNGYIGQSILGSEEYGCCRLWVLLIIFVEGLVIVCLGYQT